MKKLTGYLILILLLIGLGLLAQPLLFPDIVVTKTVIPTVEVLDTPTVIPPTATMTVSPTPTVTPKSTATSTSTSTVVPTYDPIVPTPMPTPMGHFFYTIQPGDNLWNIAQWVYLDGTKYVWICEDNNLTQDCSLIHADNVIWIPEYYGEK